jgi:hypothetical protein
MSFLKSIGGYGIKLFFFFAKGARIDAALQKGGRLRTRTMVDFPKPGAEMIMENGVAIGYNAEDILMGWRVETQGNLILKNNSKNYAYNLKLVNAEAIFDECKPLKKLTSLAPNETIEIPIKFMQGCYAHSGLEADKLPAIPKEKENKVLNIQYENESGTNFLTKFSVSFNHIYNEYTYSKNST